MRVMALVTKMEGINPLGIMVTPAIVKETIVTASDGVVCSTFGPPFKSRDRVIPESQRMVTQLGVLLGQFVAKDSDCKVYFVQNS